MLKLLTIKMDNLMKVVYLTKEFSDQLKITNVLVENIKVSVIKVEFVRSVV
jgi:uncharacterized membrane protein YebE (DUF533 family)